MTTVSLKKIIVASAKMTQKLVVGGNATGTAPVSEVLEGSTFSNMYAVDLVGTMPNIGAQNITPSATEQAISEGYHDGSGKVAGDADLVAENIKKDVQIFGVTGTLESGTAATGNATVNQVLSGATFSNATSNDLTGTMPNIGAQNITPSTSNQSISAGYHNGSGVVAGDADLIAENIKAGVTIFGVAGNVVPEDLSAYKTALDAANEESSVDLTAGIALVDTNYSDIKAAITAKGVDMTGVKPSGYDAAIATIPGPSGDAVAADLLAGKTASNNAGSFTGTRPVCPVQKSGQTVSYRANDDGDLETGEALPAPRFVDNGNGTITDNLTKLVWLKSWDNDGRKAWANAVDYCANLNYAGHEDWRLPNVKEMCSLFDLGNSSPPLPTTHLFTDIAIERYWTSNTVNYNTLYGLYCRLDHFGDYSIQGKTTEYYFTACRGPIAL